MTARHYTNTSERIMHLLGVINNISLDGRHGRKITGPHRQRSKGKTRRKDYSLNVSNENVWLSSAEKSEARGTNQRFQNERSTQGKCPGKYFNIGWKI